MSYPMLDPLLRSTDVQPIIDWLLHKGVDLSQTGFGNVQLMSWTVGYLEIKAQQGFDEAFLKFFERVRIADGSACARALRNREAIVIEDIIADEEFSPGRQVVSRAGIRAVQSTPIISSSGAFLGVMSTHFAAPHRPTRIDDRAARAATYSSNCRKCPYPYRGEPVLYPRADQKLAYANGAISGGDGAGR